MPVHMPVHRLEPQHIALFQFLPAIGPLGRGQREVDVRDAQVEQIIAAVAEQVRAGIVGIQDASIGSQLKYRDGRVVHGELGDA